MGKALSIKIQLLRSIFGKQPRHVIFNIGIQLSWLERYTDNVEVSGSNPGIPTTIPPQLRGRAGDSYPPGRHLGIVRRYYLNNACLCEWLKQMVSKTIRVARPSGVRILQHVQIIWVVGVIEQHFRLQPGSSGFESLTAC